MSLFDPEQSYGLSSAGLQSAAPLQSSAITSEPDGMKSLVDFRNPLVWFGVFLLATVGAAGVAGSVKLGPAKLAGAVGKS
jgi:hypothetical protein